MSKRRGGRRFTSNGLQVMAVPIGDQLPPSGAPRNRRQRRAATSKRAPAPPRVLPLDLVGECECKVTLVDHGDHVTADVDECCGCILIGPDESEEDAF